MAGWYCSPVVLASAAMCVGVCVCMHACMHVVVCFVATLSETVHPCDLKGKPTSLGV